jgi:hypothetical protein
MLCEGSRNRQRTEERLDTIVVSGTLRLAFIARDEEEVRAQKNDAAVSTENASAE